MKWFDKFVEQSTRRVSRRTSRRHFLARVGGVVLGAAVFPLLPVQRLKAASSGDSGTTQAHDDSRCDYWRHCAIDGYLCSCCGGSANTCPPGTEPSPVTWIGTCLNPEDERHYIISYNDCCGKTSCGRCFCNRNEGDKPVYHPSLSNDINWCLGTEVGEVYHCSTAVVIGLADDAA